MVNLVFSCEPEEMSFLWFLFYIKANYGIEELISYEVCSGILVLSLFF